MMQQQVTVAARSGEVTSFSHDGMKKELSEEYVSKSEDMDDERMEPASGKELQSPQPISMITSPPPISQQQPSQDVQTAQPPKRETSDRSHNSDMSPPQAHTASIAPSPLLHGNIMDTTERKQASDISELLQQQNPNDTSAPMQSPEPTTIPSSDAQVSGKLEPMSNLNIQVPSIPSAIPAHATSLQPSPARNDTSHADSSDESDEEEGLVGMQRSVSEGAMPMDGAALVLDGSTPSGGKKKKEKGVSCHQCFAPNTRLLLSSGDSIRAEDVKVGMHLLDEFGQPIRVTHAQCAFRRKQHGGDENDLVPSYSEDGFEFPFKERFNFTLAPSNSSLSDLQTNLTVTADHTIELIANLPIQVSEGVDGILQIAYWSVWQHDSEVIARPTDAPGSAESWPVLMTISTGVPASGGLEKDRTLAMSWASQTGLHPSSLWSPNARDFHDWLWNERSQNPNNYQQAWSMYQPSALKMLRNPTSQSQPAVTPLQFTSEYSFQRFLESQLSLTESHEGFGGDSLATQLSWLIGYWLGAVRTSVTRPTVNELYRLASDHATQDRIEALDRNMQANLSRGWFESLLRELGILNDPHFPKVMLADDVQVRRHLFAGYIDATGEIDSRVSHSYQLSTPTNSKIQDGLLHLVRGLGFKASISCDINGSSQIQVSGVPSDARYVDLESSDSMYVPVVMTCKRMPTAVAIDSSSYNWQCAVSPTKHSPLATRLPASIEYVMIEVNRFNDCGQKLPPEFQSHKLLSAESIVYHNCKTNKDDSTLLFCVNKAEKGQKKRNCRKKYCDACLRRAYNSPIDSLTPEEIAAWHCPACQDKCVCAACARKHENVNSNDKAAAMQRLLQIGPGAAMALMSGVRPNVALMQLQIAAAHAAGVQPSAMTPEQSAAVLRSAGAVVTPAAIAPAQPSSSPIVNGGSATPALSTPIVAGGSATPITAAKVVFATPATAGIAATSVATPAEEPKKEEVMLIPTSVSIASNSVSPAPVVATAVASIQSRPVAAGIVVSAEAVPATTGNQSKKRTKSGTKTSVKGAGLQVPPVHRPSISAPVSPAHSSSTAVLSFPPSNPLNSVNTIPFPGGLFSTSSQGAIPSTISHPNRRINRDDDKYNTMPERHRRHSLKVTPMSIRNGPHHHQIARALLVQEDDSDSSGSGSNHGRHDFSLPTNFASQMAFDQSRDASSSSSYYDSIHTRPTKHYKSKNRRNSVPHLMHRSTAPRPNADAIAVNNDYALPAIDLSQNGEEESVQQPPQRQRQLSAHSNASHSHTPITPSQGIVVTDDSMMMSPPHQHAFTSPRTQQHLNGSTSSSSSQLAPSSKPFGVPSNYYDQSNPNSHLHLSPSQPGGTMLISPSNQNHLLQPTIQISPQVSPRTLEYQQSMLASYLQQQQQQPIYASPRTINSQVESEFLNQSNSQLLEQLSQVQASEGLNLPLSLDDPATLNTINQLQVTVQSVINSKTAHPVQHSRSAFQPTQLPRLPQVSNEVQLQRSPLNMHQQQLLLNQSSQVASPQNHLHLQAMTNAATFRQQSDQNPLDLPPFQPELPIDPSYSNASGGDAFSFDPYMTTGASSTSYSQHASPTFSFTSSQPFFHKQVSRSNTSTPSFLNSSPNNSPRNLLFSNHQVQSTSQNTSHSMATTAVTVGSRYSMSPSDPTFRAGSPNSSAFVTHSNISSTSTAGSSQFYSLNTHQAVQFHAGTSDQQSDPLQMLEEQPPHEQEDAL